jgi:hypothetical protein
MLKKIFTSIGIILAAAVGAYAVSPWNVTYSSTTGKANAKLAGDMEIYNSTSSESPSYTVKDGTVTAAAFKGDGTQLTGVVLSTDAVDLSVIGFNRDGAFVTVYNPFVKKAHQYKGNLHIHTTISDGASTPYNTLQIYKNLGYDFIQFSDHYVTVTTTPISGILLLGAASNRAGYEDSTYRDMLAVYVSSYSLTYATDDDQKRIDFIQDQGGLCILAHPNLNGINKYYTYDQIRELKRYTGMELWSVSQRWYYQDSTDKWDAALSLGRKVWGFANDDKEPDNYAGYSKDVVNANS